MAAQRDCDLHPSNPHDSSAAAEAEQYRSHHGLFTQVLEGRMRGLLARKPGGFAATVLCPKPEGVSSPPDGPR